MRLHTVRGTIVRTFCLLIGAVQTPQSSRQPVRSVDLFPLTVVPETERDHSGYPIVEKSVLAEERHLVVLLVFDQETGWELLEQPCLEQDQVEQDQTAMGQGAPVVLSLQVSVVARGLQVEAGLRPAVRATSFGRSDKNPLLPMLHRERGSRRRTGGS